MKFDIANTAQILSLTTLLVGYSYGQSNQPTITDNPVTTKFPYEMTSDQKIKFVERVKSLKVGDSYGEVRKALGNPFDEKTIRGKKFNDPVRGVSVTYYLQKNSRDIANEKKDKSVSIRFDNDKKLVDILTNVEGLSTNLSFSLGELKIWRLP